MALTQYAAVSVTPESDMTVITCANPLGVVPQLVRVRTNDRTQASARIYEFVLTQSFGAALNRYNNNENARECIPTDSTPASTNYRAYYMTASTIEIVRTAASAQWKAGVTYTFHIYA